MVLVVRDRVVTDLEGIVNHFITIGRLKQDQLINWKVFLIQFSLEGGDEFTIGGGRVNRYFGELGMVMENSECHHLVLLLDCDLVL